MVGIVVLNYLNYKMTEQCVNKLLKQRGVATKIVIVDNCSPNNSYDELLSSFKQFSNVVVIKNTENGGYARGNNVGLKYLSKMECQWGMIVNPDVLIADEYFASKMVNVLKSLPFAGALGPNVLTTNGRSVLPYYFQPNFLMLCFEDIIRPLFTIIWNAISNNIKRPLKVYRIHGCCMFFEIEKLQRVNWLDETTFLYWEEAILSEKFLKNGICVYYVPNIYINHHHAYECDSDKYRKIMHMDEKSMRYYLENYLGKSERKIEIIVFLRGIVARFKLLIARCFNHYFVSKRKHAAVE